MEYQLYKNIICHADICIGKPIIKGTGKTVQWVMTFILAGDSDGSVLESYPGLTREDLQAIHAFLG